jgi:hypothetical protein
MSARGLSNQDETASGRPMRGAPDYYEPPRVEKALTPAELEQEILYAGADPQTDDTDGNPM